MPHNIMDPSEMPAPRLLSKAVPLIQEDFRSGEMGRFLLTLSEQDGFHSYPHARHVPELIRSLGAGDNSETNMQMNQSTPPAGVGQTPRWSVSGVAVHLVVPVLVYLLGASLTLDIQASAPAQANVMLLGLAFAAFGLRIGAMLLFVMAVYRIFFTAPGTSSPGWMTRRSS